MGFFDFFKSSKKQNVQPENIDKIFEMASNDIAYRPLFYRTILEMDLYLLTFPIEGASRGEFVADKDTQIRVKNFEDGKVPIFTSTEKIFENGIITEEETYFAMKGKEIFEMFTSPTTFILNPYSIPSKEFIPEEVKKLITGEFFKPDQERKIKAGTNISIGIPANYPTAMVESLKKYCETRKEIKGAYIALMHDSNSNEAPHLLVGLDVKGNLIEIFGEVNETIRPHIQVGEPVDMMDVSGNGTTALTLKRKQHQIY